MATPTRNLTHEELNRLEDDEYRDYMRVQLSKARAAQAKPANRGMILTVLLGVMLCAILLHNAGFLRVQP